jgi:hypothetical protein
MTMAVLDEERDERVQRHAFTLSPSSSSLIVVYQHNLFNSRVIFPRLSIGEAAFKFLVSEE